jgi:hypothetical protein
VNENPRKPAKKNIDKHREILWRNT